MTKLYGSLQNRMEENKQFCEEIVVGTGVTEYYYSDRDAYEVIEVIDQKHVTIRKYDHVHVGDGCMDNNWKLVSNVDNPTYDLVKRGKYWYSVLSVTPEDAQKMLEDRNPDMLLWAAMNDFNLDNRNL